MSSEALELALQGLVAGLGVALIVNLNFYYYPIALVFTL